MGGRLSALLLLFAVMAVAVGCGDTSADSNEAGEAGRTTVVAGAKREPAVPLPETAPKSLVVRDLRLGWGVAAKPGDKLTTKLVAKFIDGRPFESSWAPGAIPFSFKLGAEEASPGWEKGIPGMRVGGRRELIVPPDLVSRYTKLESGDSIVYVAELLGVQPPELDGRFEPRIKIPPGPPPKDLVVNDLIEGQGPEAETGDWVTLQYASRHYTGKPFSNSWDDGHPFWIRLGAESFKSIPGWEKGLPGMRVGGRRELIVPPRLIFQNLPPRGSTPDETLVYVVDLFGLKEGAEQKRGSGQG